MKKVVLMFLAMVCVTMGIKATEVVPDRSWYDGQSSPYVITTLAQLITLPDIVNSGEDDFDGDVIKLGGRVGHIGNWTPIGTSDKPFNGTFDGNKQQLVSFRCDQPELEDVGFFGFIGEKAVVKDLTIEVVYAMKGKANVGSLAGVSAGSILNCTVYISSNAFVTNGTGGGLVGTQKKGLIRNCVVKGAVEGKGKNITLGGLIGIVGGTVYQCSTEVTINGEMDGQPGTDYTHIIGGLAGQQNNFGDISECCATGTITCDGFKQMLGGLVGYQVKNISNSYASVDIDCGGSTMHIGGFVGNQHSGNIDNSYSTGKIIAGQKGIYNPIVGAFIGYRDGGAETITSCFFDNESNAGRVHSGIGRENNFTATVSSQPRDMMYQQATFADWDFDAIWEIKEGEGYPTLRMDETRGPEIPELPVVEAWWDDSWYKDKESPYIIETEGQLATLAKIVSEGVDDFKDETIILMEDLHLGYSYVDGSWSPIGNEDNPFNGTFDGNGKTLHGLKIIMLDGKNIGLFGVIGANGTVKNLTIRDCGDFGGETNVGILAGSSYGDISNCNVSSNNAFSVSKEGGGLVGHQYGGTISNSKVEKLHITGSGIKHTHGNDITLGGLVGKVSNVKISDCNVTATISAQNVLPDYFISSVYIGGLVGRSEDLSCTHSSADIEVSIDINAKAHFGGFSAGLGSNTEINECFATGKCDIKSGSVYAGGFAGFYSGTVKNSYTTVDITAEAYSIYLGGFSSTASGQNINCYSAGVLNYSADYSNVGGFVATASSGDIQKCYFNQEKAKLTKGAGYISQNATVDITALTTNEMSLKESFPTWDFYGIWKMDTDLGYPVLRMGDTETPPTPPTPDPKEMYTITLRTATYIQTSQTSGSHMIEEGERFYVDFWIEGNEYQEEDILVLVDGEETAFSRSGNSYRIMLSNIEANHTIEIAMKAYKVTIPEIPGLLTDPVAGIYEAPYGEPFSITFTLDGEYDQSVMVLLINGKVVELSPLRSTSFTYTIDKVTEPIVIEVKGVKPNDPTHISTVTSPSLEVSVSGGTLCVKTADPTSITIYTLRGMLVHSQKIIGEEKIDLSPGVYIVRSREESHKVIVK